MKIKTHEFIGKIISDIFTSLDKTSFIKGCAEPDKNIYMILTPHTKESSLTTLINLLESSFNSFNLGMVCHYLSDYCCYFHNGSNFYNALEHHFYEKNLHKVVPSIKIIHLLDISNKLTQKFLDETYENIVNHITSKYRSKKPSMKRDIIYSYILNFIVFNIYFSRNKKDNINKFITEKTLLQQI